MAPWIAANLGKKVTMIFPDYAFGYDHRDYLLRRDPGAGRRRSPTLIPIPPTESSFTRYFPQIPADTEVLYHVMVGPAVLTFVKELGEHFGSNRPQIFGFIDSLEAVPLSSPGPGVPRRHVFLGGLSALRRRRTRPSSTSSIARRSASTRTAPARPTRTTSRPTRTCSAAGRRSTSSSRRWRRAATSPRPTPTRRR